jgi:hypothetical protein
MRNYGNVGTIRISTTGNNKIFSQVTENTYSNDITNWHLGRLSNAKVTHNAGVINLNVFFGCSDMSSIGISLTIFSAGKFIRLKVFFLNPTKA